MDALALLRMDHDKLRDLFDAVSRTFNPEIHRLLLGEIRFILDSHSDLEETIFYPALENFSELNLIIKTSYQEHGHFKTMLRELDDTPRERDEWKTRLKAFLQYVEQHIATEEEEVFSFAEKLMPAADRLRLGQYMKILRERQGLGAA
jgi:hemerythrin superfamily protein